MTGRPRARAICTLALLCLFTLGITAEAWARVGGGRSMGSRGFSRPSPTQRPSQRQNPNSQQQARPAAPQSAAPGGFMRGLGGGLLGGFLGSMLFSGMAGAGSAGAAGQDGSAAGSSGLGLLDILLIGVLLYLAYRFFMKRRRQAAQAQSGSYYQSQAAEPEMFGGQAVPPPPPPQGGYDDHGNDLERGLAHIKSMEPEFDEAFFQDRAMDVFFKLQAAHGQRDISGVRDLLSDEMAGELQRDLDLLKTQGRVNRLENIAVRSVDIVQAWQEMGQDYLAVRFLANLLDYVVDDKTGAVLEGSNSQPVKFEEYWTFTRPVGPGPWRLCAITQPN
ncbi:hypothetical protein AAU61_03355 [Desulfocarbo indianensis]|nr:hypothetical protein AAU61_03355 [Desulfocarbo indianensis]